MSHTRTKAEIEQALARHHTRIACLLVENFALLLDLVDAQPPVILEALIEESKRRIAAGPPSRQGIREAVIEYCKGSMKDVMERERQLYGGITGTK